MLAGLDRPQCPMGAVKTADANWGGIAVASALETEPWNRRVHEVDGQSGNAGGLPQWPAKSLVIVGFAFLLVQGISELIKRIAVMRGLIPDPHASQVHALEAEVEHLVEAIEKR